jgi:hypothetical protein
MPDYESSVFVNCPFDAEYQPLFRAIIFTIYRCGYYPVSALSEDDSTVNRLSKIERLIEACKYGVHDLSRTELNQYMLPRFNMPFELGIFFGAKKFGIDKQKDKAAIIFDKEPFRYQSFISDLNGVDIKAHSSEVDSVIEHLRNWLALRKTHITGHKTILYEYNDFMQRLPKMLERAGLNNETLPFNDYCNIVEKTIKRILKF